MCEFHESTCNGFGDIWWTDNPIYFSSIDRGLPTACEPSKLSILADTVEDKLVIN